MNIVMSDIEMKKTLRRLKGFENSFISKKTRKAIRNATKICRQRIRQYVAVMIGGSMGADIIKSLILKAPKKRKRNVVRLMVTMRDYESMIHETRIKDEKASKKAHDDHFAKTRESKDIVVNVKYFIPAAIEYGHVGPYMGIKSGGPGKPKVAAPRPAFQWAAKNARPQMINSVINELRSEMDKWKSTSI